MAAKYSENVMAGSSDGASWASSMNNFAYAAHASGL
jgi:hypothetical protein